MTDKNTTKSFAILHLDLVGYSKLVGGDDEETVRQFFEEMGFVRDILERFGGLVRSRAGDSYLVTFSTLRNAFDAAFEVQSRKPMSSEETPLVFRIGIHIGDVFDMGGEIVGNAINIAARLEGIAEPGGICISRAARDLALPKVKQKFVCHGDVVLKNIDEPMEVYKTRPNPKVHAIVREKLQTKNPVTRPKILIRPFATLNDDPRSICFASGFTTDLISRLSRFRHVDVIGHASSFAVGTRTIDNDAAEKVDARYVASGQFQILGNRLRSTVVLLDAKCDRVLWSERFDRDLDDFFEVQTEIEDLTTSAMAVTIELAERDAARVRDPSSLDAYSMVVNGRLENLEDGASGQLATERAMRFFSDAAAIDSNYAAALAGISRAHSVQWRFGWTKNIDASLDEATKYALRAIEADQNDATAHAELGFVSLYRREHDRSLAAYRHALSLNPSDAAIIASFADALKHSGEPAEAIPHFERALELNPLKPDLYLSDLAHAYFLLRDFNKAIETIRKMRQPLTAQRVLTASLMLAGRKREGLAEAEILRSKLPGFSAEKWSAIVPDKLPEHSALLREGLQQAGF